MATDGPGWVRRTILRGDIDGLQPLPVAGMSGERRREALRIAIETRRFEIERFWQRSAFFWAFTAALFAAFGASRSATLDERHFRLMICLFGLLAAEAWTLQNRGARYWQEAWEQKVRRLEFEILGTHLFTNKEPVEYKGWFGASRFSVSKLTIMFSDGCVAAWLLLIGRAGSPLVRVCRGDQRPLAGTTITAVLAILMPVLARATPDRP